MLFDTVPTTSMRYGTRRETAHMPRRTTDGRPAASRRTRRPQSAASSYASTAGVRARMQVQRTRDTAPEMAVRRLLHSAGFRYRVDRAPLEGMRRRADIVFGPARVAVFIDGCFWHGCPQHGRPQTRANPDYWAEKLERNRARDADTDRRLSEAGWAVVRAWEHEAPDTVAASVANVVNGRNGCARRLRASTLAP